MFNFEDFSANFHPIDQFLVKGHFTSQKLENEKIKLQISILGGVKLKKT